jgi:hypothetical protein
VPAPQPEAAQGTAAVRGHYHEVDPLLRDEFAQAVGRRASAIDGRLAFLRCEIEASWSIDLQRLSPPRLNDSCSTFAQYGTQRVHASSSPCTSATGGRCAKWPYQWSKPC